jgi:hypothetical protein
MQVQTKTEFAKTAGVSAGRVSQWIAAGKIGPEELEGTGRQARIRVDAALKRLQLKLDPGQRLGNGLETRLGPADDLDLKLKQAKLAQAEASNAKAAEEAMARRGVYVRAEDAAAEAGRLAGTIMQAFEGGLSDVAAEIAAQYKLPQRDVVHLMRKRFREVRARVSAKLASDAVAVPALIEDRPES